MSLEQQFRQQSDLKASMAQLRDIMKGDPSSLINGLMQSNPQFAKFWSTHSVWGAHRRLGNSTSCTLTMA